MLFFHYCEYVYWLANTPQLPCSCPPSTALTVVCSSFSWDLTEAPPSIPTLMQLHSKCLKSICTGHFYFPFLFVSLKLHCLYIFSRLYRRVWQPYSPVLLSSAETLMCLKKQWQPDVASSPFFKGDPADLSLLTPLTDMGGGKNETNERLSLAAREQLHIGGTASVIASRPLSGNHVHQS